MINSGGKPHIVNGPLRISQNQVKSKVGTIFIPQARTRYQLESFVVHASKRQYRTFLYDSTCAVKEKQALQLLKRITRVTTNNYQSHDGLVIGIQVGVSHD